MKYWHIILGVYETEGQIAIMYDMSVSMRIFRHCKWKADVLSVYTECSIFFRYVLFQRIQV